MAGARSSTPRVSALSYSYALSIIRGVIERVPTPPDRNLRGPIRSRQPARPISMRSRFPSEINPEPADAVIRRDHPLGRKRRPKVGGASCHGRLAQRRQGSNTPVQAVEALHGRSEQTPWPRTGLRRGPGPRRGGCPAHLRRACSSPNIACQATSASTVPGGARFGVRAHVHPWAPAAFKASSGSGCLGAG